MDEVTSGAILNERELLERLCAPTDRRLVITPIIDARAQFQPSSFELRLGTEFITWRLSKIEFLDLLQPWRFENGPTDLREVEKRSRLELAHHIEKHVLPYDGKFVLHP